MIQRLVPNARVGIGHGQMEGKKLEELMLAFRRNLMFWYTTIIVKRLMNNTIFIIMLIILVCLTCIRCEVVGRSNKKAFFYFICPPLNTDDARRELKQFSDLRAALI
jgi:transcription-repair coupling factor (superfamily II helicase)